MATKEFIEKRIASAEQALTKLNKKLERIKKAEATNWEINPYYYNEYDLRRCLREIEEKENALRDYKDQLEKEEEKANSRNVQVIIDFLNNWEKEAYDYYMTEKEKYEKVYNEYRTWLNTNRDEIDTDCRNNGDWTSYRERTNALYDEANKKLKQINNQYSDIIYFLHKTKPYEEAVAYELKKEKDRKYDEIIRRTNEIVGEITDATYLTVNPKGDLDGFIIGTRGKARVNTIGAGGYNQDVIVNTKHGQRFHFRTLVRPMRD